MNTSPWIETTPRIAGQQVLASRYAEVVVVGGGLAGLTAAMTLAEAGVDVVVLEARDDVAKGISGRQPGMALVGLADNPHRLVAAMGISAAKEIVSFGLRNSSLVHECGHLDVVGSLALAKGQERDELADTVCAAEALGLTASEWGQAEVEQSLGVTGMGGARFVAEDGLVDPRGLCRSIAQRAMKAGTTILCAQRVVRIVDEDNAVSVHTRHHRITTELVVLCGGAQMTPLDPFFTDKLYPVRTQMVSLDAGPDRFVQACTAQYGHTFWRQGPAGSLIIGGCRWATAHLEVGETDDTTTSDDVEARIMGFVKGHIPDLANAAIRSRWSAIMNFTCDGLPIVGPIPGRPRYLVCGGFNGQQQGLGMAAGVAVAQGVLTGSAEGVPRCFSPGRFVG